MAKKSTETLLSIRAYYNDLLIIIGIVTALTVSDIYLSKADLDCDVNFINCYYNEEDIYEDFLKYNIDIPVGAFERLKAKKFVKFIDMCNGFSKNNPIDTLAYEQGLLTDSDPISELKRALKYEYRDFIGDFKLAGTGWINNSAYWENEAVEILSASLDSLNLFNAMSIILAHREITSLITVVNNGDLTAEKIGIFIKRPFLLNPRLFISTAKVEFLYIKPEYFNMEVLEDKVKITLDYLIPAERFIIYLTTSLTNISKNNIYLHFETERILDFKRLFYTFIITLLLYYFIPIIFIGIKSWISSFKH